MDTLVRFRPIVVLAAAAAAALALAGCAGSSGKTADPAGVEGTWVTGDDYDAPEVPFVDFAADGSWTASDGCNGAQGTWQLSDDGAFSAESNGFSTLIACDGVDLPGMVTEAVAVDAGDDSLRLLDADGTELVALQPAPAEMTDDTADAGATDTGATGSAPAGVAGTWTSAVPNAQLVLGDDGTVTGNDGCVALSGSWTEADSVVTLGALTPAAGECAGVDTWLRDANSLSVDGSTAGVLDAAGTEIGTLTRAG